MFKELWLDQVHNACALHHVHILYQVIMHIKPKSAVQAHINHGTFCKGQLIIKLK